MAELLLPSEPVTAMLQQRFDDDKTAAHVLGTTRATVMRWREQGMRIRERNADRIATKLGVHPTALWPDWYELIEAHEQAILDAHRAANHAKNQARNRRRAQARSATT